MGFNLGKIISAAKAEAVRQNVEKEKDEAREAIKEIDAQIASHRHEIEELEKARAVLQAKL